MGMRGCSGLQLCLLLPVPAALCHRAVRHRFPTLGMSSKTISNQSAKRAFTSIGLAFPQGQPQHLTAIGCFRLQKIPAQGPHSTQQPLCPAPSPASLQPLVPSTGPSQLQSRSGEGSNSSRGSRQSSLHCKTSLQITQVYFQPIAATAQN